MTTCPVTLRAAVGAAADVEATVRAIFAAGKRAGGADGVAAPAAAVVAVRAWPDSLFADITRDVLAAVRATAAGPPAAAAVDGGDGAPLPVRRYRLALASPGAGAAAAGFAARPVGPLCVGGWQEPATRRTASLPLGAVPFMPGDVLLMTIDSEAPDASAPE